jgi:topoisomerase-4 subunit A
MSADKNQLELGKNPNAAREIYEGNDGLKDLIDFNFLEYASYVIRDRAIPHINDGLKPVQRRIMWSLRENDDGKFIKVANIVGYSMQYHPHGDASIADALVNLTNRRYLIEGQGNFGNILTGDPAAASRYIECRLTELARTQLFNKNLTEFIPSYDGRKQEPVTLPAKIPLLLMLGAEGIAVGLSTKILPHNFGELIKAQIAILKKRSFKVLPDFLQGGIMDAQEYDKGRGKIKLRAKIKRKDANKLIIHEIPYGTTTESLIKSIEDATRKKKIKIKSISDYTAEHVEIHVTLAQGETQDKVEQAMYAFTDCEVSISSNLLVIKDNRPQEMTVDEVLRYNTDRLVYILEQELLFEKNRLLDEFHNKTLVQIFVENRIYRDIEKCKSYAKVQQAVLDGVNKFRKMLKRDVTLDDVEMLLAVRIKRISQFDIDKNRKDIDDILIALDEVEKNLGRLTDYTVKYLQDLHKKYAKEFPRRTQTGEEFEEIEVRELTASELAITYDPESGYLGYDVKKGDELMKCSSLDKLLVAYGDGCYKLVGAPDKLYVGDTLHFAALFDRDRPMIMVYASGPTTYIKRFKFGGTIMNREYRLCPEKSAVSILDGDNPEHLYVKFKPAKNQKVHQMVVDVHKYAIKGAKTKGNQLTVKKIAKIATKPPRGWKDSNISPDAQLMDF